MFQNTWLIHHDWHIIKRRIYLRTESDKNYTNTDAKGLLNRQDKVPDLRRSWTIKTRPLQVRIRPGSAFSRSQKTFPRLLELTKPNVKGRRIIIRFYLFLFNLFYIVSLRSPLEEFFRSLKHNFIDLFLVVLSHYSYLFMF